MPDTCVAVREGGAGRERLDVSTWLIIQSDYPCLAAPTGRPLSTSSLLGDTCLGEMTQQRISLRQADITHPPPHSPHITSAAQGTRGISQCSVQDNPLCGGDSWWKLQPTEMRLDSQNVLSIHVSEKNIQTHTHT